MMYSEETYGDGKGRLRNGSPTFYKLLETMAELHDRKSHDYASNDSPTGNYRFAGMLSKLFNNPDDAGFVGRIGEKLYRLANLENSGKVAKNESIEDTELDICVIIALWMADRRDRRASKNRVFLGEYENNVIKEKGPEPVDPNPLRSTLCFFCSNTVDNDNPKVISGQYKQAHIWCYKQWQELKDSSRLQEFRLKP
jgi:hypothetical protein